MNALPLLSHKMEAVFGKSVPHQLQQQIDALREALHQEDECMMDLATYYQEVILPKYIAQGKSLSTFTDIAHVEVMLAGISAIRSQDFEGYLAAIACGVKYFRRTDLFNSYISK